MLVPTCVGVHYWDGGHLGWPHPHLVQQRALAPGQEPHYRHPSLVNLQQGNNLCQRSLLWWQVGPHNHLLQAPHVLGEWRMFAPWRCWSGLSRSRRRLPWRHWSCQQHHFDLVCVEVVRSREVQLRYVSVRRLRTLDAQASFISTSLEFTGVWDGSNICGDI